MSLPQLSYSQSPRQESHRDAPPSGAPPAYARIYPYSIRPLLLVSTIVSFFYLIILGIASLKAMSHEGETAKLKTFDAVQGALFIGAAAIEVFGFGAAWLQRVPLAKLYSNLSLVAFLAVMASELLGIVIHFTMKSDIINACTTMNAGKSYRTQGGFWWSSKTTSVVLTEAEAREECGDQWSKNSTWDIIWLIVTAFVGALFVAFSFAFVRQLLDPQSIRTAPRSVFNRQSVVNGPPSAYPQQYSGPYNSGNQGRYDSEDAFSYPPPQGPPPNLESGALPDYDSRGRDSLDDDKHPGGYGYGGYEGYNERESMDRGRPGSSRQAGPYRESEDVKGRESEETLRESVHATKGKIEGSDDRGHRV